jgi:FixJ family two-component response regulator
MLKKSKKLENKKQQPKRQQQRKKSLAKKPQSKKENPDYNEETFRSLSKFTSTEDIVARLYAWEGLYKHITDQIKISKKSPDRYRRRESIRLQIAFGLMENLLKEGEKAAIDFDD